MSDAMAAIRNQLQAKVSEPIQYYGFYMSKGSFTKLPAGVTSGVGKMLGGLLRKKQAGDLGATSTGAAMFGLDNHQTALVLTATSLYAIDTTTSMTTRQMSFGNVLGAWPRAELAISGTARQRPGDVMLLNLDIKHEATGQGGQLETMAYTNLGDPSWDCYRALTGE